MSWHRNNWERKNYDSFGVPPDERADYRLAPRPFELVREVKPLHSLSLVTILHDAAVACNPDARVSLRGSKDLTPATTILSVHDMRSLGTKNIPSDKVSFLTLLAQSTETSMNELEISEFVCGLFGRPNNGFFRIGVAIRGDAGQIISSERAAGADIVMDGGSEQIMRNYPHISIGSIPVHEIEINTLKPEINRRLAEVGSIALLPVRAGRSV